MKKENMEIYGIKNAFMVEELKGHNFLKIGSSVVISEEILTFNNDTYVLAATMSNDLIMNIGLINTNSISICDNSNLSNETVLKIVNSHVLFLTPIEKIEYEIIAERLLTVPKDLFYEPEKPIVDMTNEELRKYVTIFKTNGFLSYNQMLSSVGEISSNRKAEIVNELNKEFDARFNSEFIDFYNFFDKIENREKWGGELRYTLLSYSLTDDVEFRVFCLAKKAYALDFSKHENVLALLNMTRNIFRIDYPNKERASLSKICSIDSAIVEYCKFEEELNFRTKLVEELLLKK